MSGESKWNYKRIGDLRRAFKKMNIEEDNLNFIISEIKNRDDRIEALLKIVDLKNRKCVPFEDRKLIVDSVDSHSSKLTINPCDGRVSLKISDKTNSENIKNDLVNFTKKIMKVEFEPITHRGKITFNPKDGCYWTTLSSETRRFNRTFTYKDNVVTEMKNKKESGVNV